MQKLAQWVVAACCLAVIAGAFAVGPRPGSPGIAIGALLAGIALELKATPLALGYFSPAAGWVIALTALPQVGLGWALACVACGIAARVLLQPASANGPLADLTVDFVPAALAGWATYRLGLAWASPIYLLVALPLPRALSNWLAPRSRAGKTRTSLALEHLALVSLGPAGALLGQQQVGLTLLIVPPMLALLRAASTGAELSEKRAEQRSIRAAKSELNFQEKMLSQTEERQVKLQRLLDARADTFALLEALSARSFSEKQALDEALKALHAKLAGAECLFLPAGEYPGDTDLRVGLQTAWNHQEPWFHQNRAAFPLPLRGLVVITAPSRLNTELQHTLRVFFYYLNVMLERVRFQENLVQALHTEAGLRKELSVAVTRLQALLQGAGELASLVQPREILQLAVERAGQWTGRECAARHAAIEIGSPPLQALHLPLCGGEFRIAAGGLEEGEVEALRLWLVLVGGALERCQAQAGLAQSSRLAAIGQLAAGVAHELNTPLGSISLAIGMAARNLEKNPDKAASRLELARRSVEQMRSIVAKLLNYSRESGEQRRAMSLAEVVRDSVQLVDQSFQLEKIELDSQAEEVLVEVNPGEVQQVLVNLLVNARLAVAGAQQPRVAVRAIREGDMVRVSIEDNGPGVPAELVERIFEPFFTTRDVGSGVGLGLSISREIITTHGGELSYRPATGGGACFSFTLPVCEEAA